jgi:hypothetical protein
MTERTPDEPVDLVYTWVDDRFSGYVDTLNRYADKPADASPNRTRDNLDLIKYSLRSVERRAPWIRRIVILSCRPQVPEWLDTRVEGLEVVHHDQIMDPAILPTFNSFAIITHLHLIPDLSRRFVYLEDDMLLTNRLDIRDFLDDDGRYRVFEAKSAAPTRRTEDPGRSSPWNLALATSNHLLDERFGPADRRRVEHQPLLIDKSLWAEMLEEWPDETAATRGSRFRANGNIAPEYLYPHWLLARGLGVPVRDAERQRFAGYAPLEDFLPLTWFVLWRIGRTRPVCCTLNDNFGARPNPRAERFVRRTLDKWFPEPSRWELAPGR